MMSVDKWAAAAQKLVMADDPQEIRRLESVLEMTQEEAVNHYVEDSCCSEDLPQYAGGKGTSAERLAALRSLWQGYERQTAGF